MNSVIISGRMGGDAEMRMTPAGKPIAQWRMALDSMKRDAPAEWVSVVAWEKTAEFVRDYLGKGRKILVDGRLQVREWDDKQTGQKRSAVEIVASRVEFMDSPKDQQPASKPAGKPTGKPPAEDYGKGGDYFDDDTPF